MYIDFPTLESSIIHISPTGKSIAKEETAVFRNAKRHTVWLNLQMLTNLIQVLHHVTRSFSKSISHSRSLTSVNMFREGGREGARERERERERQRERERERERER
jgi:hypothetical protein